MPLEKRTNAEPIPGYRLLEKLGAGGFGEVWKCEAPGGIQKAIKFVYGNLRGLDATSGRAAGELEAVQRIKAIRHPFLLSIDRVECIQGDLVIVSELAERNLLDLWQQYAGRGRVGLPRAELLGYLRETAEVLDLLNQKYHLQHLDIKPTNLFLLGGHVKVADFGLVNSLASDLRVELAAVTPLFAAPELFHKRLSRHCDQYSLALVYVQLLTGGLPFAGKNTRQLMVQHTTAAPDLRGLGEADRPAIARALAKDPEQRFACCMDLVRALEQHSPAPPAAARSSELPTAQVLPSDLEPEPAAAAAAAAAPRPVLPPGVLADERFLERLSVTASREAWKSQSPDQRVRQVQILYASAGGQPRRLEAALAQLRALQHPGLVPIDVVLAEPGRVVVASEFLPRTLRDRFLACQARKEAGIPRGELLEYLRAAADVFDFVHQQHNVQHLALQPSSLILNDGCLQIGEFGFAQLLWGLEALAQRCTRYSAPELADGATSSQCDQFSLALIYAEMLTGVHPFRGLSADKYRRSKMPPDLARLPAHDQAIVARALHLSPSERWSSCGEMVQALDRAGRQHEPAERPDFFAHRIAAEKASASPSSDLADPSPLGALLGQLLCEVGGEADPGDSMPFVQCGDNMFRQQFQVGLPLGTARAKLETFSREIYAQRVESGETRCKLHFELPSTLMQKLFGRSSTLVMEVRLARVNPLAATPVEVTSEITLVHCRKKQALARVEQTALQLLDNLRRHLMVNSEKRMRDRLLWPHPLWVIPVVDGEPEEPVECRGKDISQTGIGFFLPHDLQTADILVELPRTSQSPGLRLPATLVRAKRCADGWYEVGAIFQMPTVRKASHGLHHEPVAVNA